MAALLEVAGLHKRYGAIVVADDVTFSLERGTCLGMIGPNGAGKSSVFNLIAGTVAPDGGSIRFDGREITRQPAHLRARLGIVRAFQIPQPFPHLTVYENVLAAACFGAGLRGSHAEEWAIEVLAAMNLLGKAELLAGQLPLLDRKRLQIAKAIASRAKLLLLDEIAAGLTEREIEAIASEPAERISRRGISLVPEGRLLFPSLTVEENLLMGALNRRASFWTLARVYDLFPVLAERRRQMPNRLSGGQQHMVAIGRALMLNPTLLLCDEISLGLAPVVVEQIYKSFANIRAEGTSLVLVEQDVKRAAAAANRVYCLLKGRVTLEGSTRDMSLDQLSRAYFGI